MVGHTHKVVRYVVDRGTRIAFQSMTSPELRKHYLSSSLWQVEAVMLVLAGQFRQV